MKSDGSSECGCIAKVADFGLAVKMDHQDTHVSAFQVQDSFSCLHPCVSLLCCSSFKQVACRSSAGFMPMHSLAAATLWS